MALVSRQMVLAQLAATFPDAATAAEALASLERYGTDPYEPAVEAVRLAVLLLCDGKVWRLRELVREAKRDFRDVLFPAQRLVGWGPLLSR